MFGKQQVLRKCNGYDNNNTVVQIMVSGTRRPELDSWSLLADDLGKVTAKSPFLHSLPKLKRPSHQCETTKASAR